MGKKNSYIIKLLYRRKIHSNVTKAKCYTCECVQGECKLGEWVLGESLLGEMLLTRTGRDWGDRGQGTGQWQTSKKLLQGDLRTYHHGLNSFKWRKLYPANKLLSIIFVCFPLGTLKNIIDETNVSIFNKSV